MKSKLLCVSALTAMLSASGVASAGLVGLSVENGNAANTGADLDAMGLIAWRVYANFDNAADGVLGVGGDSQNPHMFVSTGGVTLHDATNEVFDIFTPDAGIAGDSYLTVGEAAGTSVTPGFAGSGFGKVVSGDQWNVGEEGIFRAGGFFGTKVLIAQFVLPADQGAFTYSGRLSWRDGAVPGANFHNFVVGNSIPAPGALAVLGLGLMGRRRRRG